MEVLGAGMVHRNVFRSVNYNPDEVTGFAFGLNWIDSVMLKIESKIFGHFTTAIFGFYDRE